MRLAVISLFFLRSAWAESSADVTRLLADARFEEARQTASRLLQLGSAASPKQTAELHFSIAQSSAALGDVAEAERSFARALELVPALQLPVGTSPKLTAPYEAARRRLEGQTLTVVPSGSRVGARAIVTVRVSGDPMHLFARGLLRTSGAEVPLAPTDPPQASLECAPGRCTYRITLIDVAGNPLLEAGTEAAPLLLSEAVPQPEQAVPSGAVVASTDEPWFKRPLPYFMLAAVGAAGAGLLGWQGAVAEARTRAMLATPANQTYAELQRQASTRDGLIGGTVALAALVLTSTVIGVFVW